MSTALPFVGREAEIALLQQRWQASTTGLGTNVITLVGETGVGKSRIVQQLYRHLSTDPAWDPHHFWPDAFQTHATQLRVNPEFTAADQATGAPHFVWLGLRWSNAHERNVTNSLTLPTLKEQLTQIANQVAYARPRPQRLVEAVKNDAVTAAKELATGQVEDLVEGVIASFFPYYKLIKTVFDLAEETRDVLGLTGAPPTIHDQLISFFQRWFAQPSPLPIILWLDDVQWIDAESTHFLGHFIHTAHERQWPLLVIATCWPREWQTFPADFFLKPHADFAQQAWPWVVVHELSTAPASHLHTLLHHTFPHLPVDQAALLVERAGGNFLTMIENIAELRSKPRYFVDYRHDNPLSEIGLTRIRQWQSNRQIRIAQRFHEELDSDIQEFLARASHAGIDTQFLRRVLVRYAATNPQVGDITDMLQRCHTTLALVAPLSDDLHEFRDRGYFTVARTYFAEWLEPQEATALRQALHDELMERIAHSFDDHGNLQIDFQRQDGTPSAIREHYAMFQLAQQLLGDDAVIAVRTLVAYSIFCAHHQAWRELNAIAPALNRVDWHQFLDVHVSWTTLSHCAHVCALAGSSAAQSLYAVLLDAAHQRYAATPTAELRQTLIDILRLHARSAYLQSDMTTARDSLQQALDVIQQTPFEQATVDQQHLQVVTLHDIGLITINQTHGHDQALTTLTTALTHARTLAASHDAISLQYLLSSILNTLIQFHIDQANFATVADLCTEHLELCNRLMHSDDTPETLVHLIDAYYNAGVLHYSNQEWDAAWSLFQKNDQLCAQLVAARGLPSDHAVQARNQAMLGRTALNRHDYAQARTALQATAAHARALVMYRGTPEDHNNLGIILSSLGQLAQAQGDLPTATACFREALDIAAQHAHTHGDTKALHTYTLALTDMGDHATTQGDDARALDYHQQARTIAAELVALRGTPNDSYILAGAHVTLARWLSTHGDFPAAKDAIQQAVAITTSLHQQYPHIATAADLAAVKQLAHHIEAGALPTPPTTSESIPVADNAPFLTTYGWLVTLLILGALLLWRWLIPT